MSTDYPPEKIISVLKTSRLFNQFDETQLIQLMAFATVEQYKKKAQIIQENVQNQTIYILLKGSVDIYVGDELILKLRRRGDIIGEMSVITKSFTTASVVAATPVEVFAIPAQKIYDSGQLELRSLWYKLFSDILAQKLSMTNKKVVGFQETSAELDLKKRELIQKTLILQSVLGSMGDGVVVTDGAGRVLHTNEAFVQMIGSLKIPVKIKEWPKKIGMFKPDGQTLYSAQDLPMTKAEKNILVESEEIYIKNDQLESGLWLLASSSLLKTEQGKQLNGCVVVFRNYTKKKLEEDALIKAKKNAEATAKAKSDFLSIMSHELRTPLNGILGMSGLLMKTTLTSEQEEWIESIDKSGQSLLTKVKNILYYNNLESGDVHVKKEKVSLKDLINTALKTYNPAAQQNQIQIAADICKDAAPFLLGDQEKIQKVIDTLLDNAVKYSNKEGPVEIIASVEEQNDDSVKFLIKVKDRGIGISKDHVKRLFLPFSQADTSYSRKFEGTGLGLAIAKKTVEMMGGDLDVESKTAQGSCFWFTLILSRLKEKEEKKSASENKDIASLIDEGYAKTNPLTILVAEDNKVNQLLIKKVLGNLGYPVEIAENGLEAFEACCNKPFDLVLMDIQMPKMDGITAAQKILKHASEPHIPRIVALTANTTGDIKETCFSAGMVDYITKPLDIKTLVGVLEKLHHASPEPEEGCEG